MKTKRLKAGVVGLGMGAVHIGRFREHPDVEVAAVADMDKKRLDAIKEKHPKISAYADPHEMFQKEKLDIVSIAVPNKFHNPLTIAAIESGSHVICEKPPAMDTRETLEMIAVAENAGKKLCINFSYRFTPQSQALKKEVESGTFGEFYYGRTLWHRRKGMPGFGGWFGNKSLAGGGPLIDLGVHRIDLALWLMGYPEPDSVLGSAYNKIAAPLAAAENKEFTVEDLACAMIRFKNGASLVVEASWAGHIKDPDWMETRLWGTEGGLMQRNLNGGYEFEAEFYTEKNGCQYDTRVGAPPGAVPSAMHDMADSLIKGTPLMVKTEEAVTVMKLLDAVYASAESGAPVKI